MNFCGLEVRSSTVIRAPNFAADATGWLSPGDHNHLPITRILRCLTVLGLEAEAKAFLERLAEIYEDEQNKATPRNQRRNDTALERSGRQCWQK